MLGILPGLLGVIQATETIKLILGAGESLVGRLLLVDALGMNFRQLKLRKNPDCVVCGPNPTVTRLIDYEEFCGIPRAKEEEKREMGVPAITVQELKEKMDKGDAFVLVDVREPHEIAISDLPGSVKIPLGTLPVNVNKLSTADDIVVHCRTGVRSAKAVQFLMSAGFQQGLEPDRRDRPLGRGNRPERAAGTDEFRTLKRAAPVPCDGTIALRMVIGVP